MKNQEQLAQAKDGKMLDITLLQHLKQSGAIKASKVMGPNGAFISWTNAAGVKNTLPVGSNSQDGVLADYGLVEAADGQLIATVNNYEEQDTVTFE
jgi:hypothetical protein